MTAPASLAVTRLQLTNFRSYAGTVLAVEAAPVVLAGPNGAGKTNVLDAISLLSPGRGLRGAKLAEHMRRGPSASEGTLWAVAATVKRGSECHEIGTGMIDGNAGRPDGESRQGKREVRLNGAAASSSADLGEIVQLIWLTPAMDRLFIESASGRRRFLDRLVLGFAPSHARASTRYETAMRERGRLLKYGPRDPGWLDGLENELAEAGVEIARARACVVEKLSGALAERGRAGAFPAAALALNDEMHQTDADALRAAFAASRMRDAEAGRTLVGPHTTDLQVRHTAKRMEARDCSTGEQKALLVSIILADARELARARAGMAPILLLDEIAAHLDSTRRAALFEEITALSAQAWMTGTDLSLFDRARAQIFEVREGRFARQEDA
ncbi:MAG: DNA replication/repair protein RecF [Alphaproteobacteria bacterium 64-11]|nr:DNA replication/repair protein RecF [Alphaproteobacteria bacterium]OJU12221.1 MAG: DNA replication/repair protein RecF [Alphaproteobacteria bacterium 64-11]